jgi:hypothetical protein
VREKQDKGEMCEIDGERESGERESGERERGREDAQTCIHTRICVVDPLISS